MRYSNSIRASVFCLLFLAAAISVSAAPGDLDPSFGSGGMVLPLNLYAYATAIQPDGKIVAAGEIGDTFALARYNADGTPDLTFGSGGKVVPLSSAAGL